MPAFDRNAFTYLFKRDKFSKSPPLKLGLRTREPFGDGALDLASDDRGHPPCAASISISRRATGHWHASICIVLSAVCLLGCADAEIHPDSTVRGAPSRPGVSGPSATAARQQNWGCQRIESAIAALIEPMKSAKARAETEQKQAPPTVTRMVARLTGPPGAGNSALADFQKLRADTNQLNGLLREKGCREYTIDVKAPALVSP